MPALTAANLTRLRTTRHATLLRVAVDVPATIWSARVNGAQAAGSRTITVDGVVQVRAPAKHYQVFFGSTAGAGDLGEARWKSYSAPTLTVSAHNAALADDTYITVVENIRPQNIPFTVDDNDITYEDGDTAYTDENEHYPPLARMGPPAVAYRDDVTGLATVRFYGDPVAIEGGTAIVAHAWDFRDGAVQGSGLSTSALQGTAVAPIVVDFATPGRRWVSYTVTCSNGKTHTTYRPVLIYDRVSGTLPYTRVELANCGGELEAGGWAAAVKVYADAPLSAFPNQAQVIVFAEDWYGAEKVSIGGQYTWRENIVLVGYIRRGTVTKDWIDGAVEFECEGIGRLADNIGAMGFSLESDATPSDWHALAALDFNLAAHHVLTQHTTLTQIADVHLDLLTYLRDYLDFQDGNVRDQLGQQVCVPVRGQFGSSAQGILYLQSDPQLLPLADRTQPVVLSTEDADLQSVELGTEQHEDQVCQIDFCSETFDGDPWFTLAPPNEKSHGRMEKVDGWRADTQAESNILAGLLEGKLNNSFDDVTLAWRGNYRVVDPFPAEAVRVNLAADENRRGLSWTNQRTWTKRASYEYTPGVLVVTTVVAKDSYGAPGITNEYPPVPPPVPPPFPPIPLPPPVVPPTPPPPAAGDGSRVYAATNVGVAYCDNFLTGPTAWTAVNGGLAGDALKAYRLTMDPFSSDGSKLTTAYLATKDGIYKNTNLPAGAWTQILSHAQVQAMTGATTVRFNRLVVAPMNLQNFVGLWVYLEDWLVMYWIYSTDGGATWQRNTANWIRGGEPDAYGRVFFKVWPSHKTSGTLYLLASTGMWWGGNAYQGYRLFRSTDAGVHWTYLGVYGASSDVAWPGLMPTMTLPFADGSGVPYAGDTKVWRRSDAGKVDYHAAFPALPPAAWTNVLSVEGPGTLLGELDLNTWDEDYIYVTQVGGTYRVHATNNGGGTWASHDTPDYPHCLTCLPSSAQFCAVAGPSAGAPAPWIELTTDGGATWADRMGDLATVLAGLDGIWGIVPDWVFS